MPRRGTGLRGRGVVGGVPEGAPVVVEGGKPVPDLGEAPAHVAERERRPVGEVTLGGGTVTGEVPQHQLGERLVAVQPPGGRHPVGEGCVRVRPLEPTAAADEPVQLEEGEQQHQHLPVRLDIVAAEAVGQLLPGLVGLLREGMEDQGGHAVETAADQPVGLGQLPSDDGTDARCGQLEQPPDVLGRDEVPRRSQHVGADDPALVQQRLELGCVGDLRAGGHRPSGLARVLGLDGDQAPDHLCRGRSVRRHEVWLRSRHLAMCGPSSPPSLPDRQRPEQGPCVVSAPGRGHDDPVTGCRITDFFELADQLPEATRVDNGRYWRTAVGDRTFGYLWEPTRTVGLKQTIPEQLALVAERPETFEVQFTTRGFGWVVVRLEGVERDELAELTFEAWRLTAPAALIDLRGELLPR